MHRVVQAQRALRHRDVPRGALGNRTHCVVRLQGGARRRQHARRAVRLEGGVRRGEGHQGPRHAGQRLHVVEPGVNVNLKVIAPKIDVLVTPLMEKLRAPKKTKDGETNKKNTQQCYCIHTETFLWLC